MISTAELPQISDELVHGMTKRLPQAELYELGAVFISIGCFLTASAIPDLWPQLKETANLSHQLLNQKENKDAQSAIT